MIVKWNNCTINKQYFIRSSPRSVSIRALIKSYLRFKSESEIETLSFSINMCCRIFFCSNGNTSRWTLNKILLVCCPIISFNNHDNNDNNNNDNYHYHCCALKHNHITEFFFALMETLECWIKFCLFVVQLFHLTIKIMLMIIIMIIIIIIVTH